MTVVFGKRRINLQQTKQTTVPLSVHPFYLKGKNTVLLWEITLNSDLATAEIWHLKAVHYGLKKHSSAQTFLFSMKHNILISLYLT